MPDIQMCPSTTCLVRRNCQRNQQSGTVPTEFWQAWGEEPADQGILCTMYLPYMRKKYVTVREALSFTLTTLVMTMHNRKGGRDATDYESGWDHGWHYAANSIMGTVGPDLCTVGTLEGEIKVFLGAPEQPEKPEGDWVDGYRQGMLAAIIGTISLLESFTDPATDYLAVAWQGIAELANSKVVN